MLTYQIFSLRTEWQKQLYITFVDFEKAFNSIRRESMAHSESLWDSPGHRPDHQELLPQFHLQHGKLQLELPSQDQRTSGLSYVCSPF